MNMRSSDARRVILVVDDDPDVRGILAMLLERDGYEVVPAVDGAAALELVSPQNVALVVVDLQMPRLEGDAFCRAFRARGGRAPILLISAASVDAATVSRLGADDYISKPFEVDRLLEAIEALLARG